MPEPKIFTPTGRDLDIESRDIWIDVHKAQIARASQLGVAGEELVDLLPDERELLLARVAGHEQEKTLTLRTLGKIVLDGVNSSLRMFTMSPRWVKNK